MKINSKNILIFVIIIVIISLLFNILPNIITNNYYKKIIKENSVQISNLDNDYKKIEVVINKYFGYIKNKEYNKIKDSSIFYAEKSDNEYDEISEKLNLNDNYDLFIQKIYILDKNIYKCEIYTKTGDIKSKTLTISIKIEELEKYFRILDIYLER